LQHLIRKLFNNEELKHPFILAKAITIKGLKRRRKIWAFLPSDYFINTTKRYPVIYFNDGQNIFEGWKAPFGRSWEVHNTMRHQKQKYNMDESILIGIEHGKRHRKSEYLPFVNHRFSVEGNIYADFVANELKTFVDKKLRTLPDRIYTSIAGSSLGGLNALYTGFKHQDVFSVVGALSPSLWAAPSFYDLITKIGKHYDMHFYLSVGTMEGGYTVRNTKKMYDTLLHAGFPQDHLHLSIVPYGKHDESLWQDEFANFYRWIH
jgi:predicted alpha/beta superfamily hydrolase